ncbi:neuronal acetylcholine receptor subunit alpha-10-like [Branchiostoma lanceolatum]|uniref:neuronal acetylcholine receptor subunit alpha-10-like n=1 Tax=Branchiostoma lanceolatum TaxID=7740 RepID=UPI00345286F9
MANYSSHVRPARNFTNPTVVYMDIVLKKIVGLNQRDQVLTTLLSINMHWKDDYMVWNPEDFGGMTSTSFLSKDLWTPKISLQNKAGDTDGSLEPLDDLKVFSDGRVFAVHPGTLYSSCRLQLHHFPFDTQTCTLIFGPWNHDDKELLLVNQSNSLVNPEHYTKSVEWALIDNNIRPQLTYHTYNPNGYSSLECTITIKRRFGHYLFTMFLPCALLLTMVLSGYLLPPNAPVRLQMSITMLLALVVLQLTIVNSLPASGDLTLITQYYVVVIVITSLSVINAAVLTHVISRRKPMAPWMEKVILVYLARAMCETENRTEPIHENGKTPNQPNSDQHHGVDVATLATETSTLPAAGEAHQQTAVPKDIQDLLQNISTDIYLLTEDKRNSRRSNETVFKLAKAAKILNKLAFIVLGILSFAFTVNFLLWPYHSGE